MVQQKSMGKSYNLHAGRIPKHMMRRNGATGRYMPFNWDEETKANSKKTKNGWGSTRLGYRRIVGNPILTYSIINEKLAAAGYFDILNCCESLHSCN
jgi:hypothetical protein